MPRKIPVWEPPAEALEAMGPESGKAYNGYGSDELRPPKPFFWHEASMHPWGDMQAYTFFKFYEQDHSAEIYDAFSMSPDTPGVFMQRGPLPVPKAPTKVEKTPEEWSEDLKAFALANHADDFGVAALDPNWVFEGYEIEYPNIISIAVQHDYEEIKEAPSLPGNARAAIELGVQYTRAALAADTLRNYILEQGYDAEAYEGPMGGSLLMIPAAIAGGLGELGKHHSMIHPKFGSSFRLAAVGTNMPLALNTPADFGADEFCMSCQICTDNCPPAAISDEKHMVRGVEKFYVDFDKCMPYFAEARACTICLAVCPWSRPGVADGLIKKMARRRAAAK